MKTVENMRKQQKVSKLNETNEKRRKNKNELKMQKCLISVKNKQKTTKSFKTD